MSDKWAKEIWGLQLQSWKELSICSCKQRWKRWNWKMFWKWHQPVGGLWKRRPQQPLCLMRKQITRKKKDRKQWGVFGWQRFPQDVCRKPRKFTRQERSSSSVAPRLAFRRGEHLVSLEREQLRGALGFGPKKKPVLGKAAALEKAQAAKPTQKKHTAKFKPWGDVRKPWLQISRVSARNPERTYLMGLTQSSLAGSLWKFLQQGAQATINHRFQTPPPLNPPQINNTKSEPSTSNK